STGTPSPTRASRSAAATTAAPTSARPTWSRPWPCRPPTSQWLTCFPEWITWRTGDTMSDATSPRAWLIGGVGLALGLLAGYLAGVDSVRLNRQQRSLDADLYLQTSGEFRACCLQTYRLAGERLRTKLAALTTKDPPPAVIMDLDETVLDNSPFQTWLYR